jgi:hypothetical protein
MKMKSNNLGCSSVSFCGSDSTSLRAYPEPAEGMGFTTKHPGILRFAQDDKIQAAPLLKPNSAQMMNVSAGLRLFGEADHFRGDC